MANGTIIQYFHNSYFSLQLAWAESDPDIANNESEVTVAASLQSHSSSAKISSTASKNISITINGTKYSGTCTVGVSGGGSKTLFTASHTVTHDSDGSKSIAISCTLGIAVTLSGSYYSSVSASGIATLSTIARFATLNSAPNFTDDDNPTITYSNPAGSAVTSLQACISLTGAKDDVPYRDISIEGTSYTFELTDEERETLRLATTGSNSRTVIFFVKTELSGVTNYSTLPRTFTIINGTPTLEPSVIDINEKTIALTGDANILVRYQSDVVVDTGAQVYKNASVKSQRVICGNKSINAGNGTIEDVGSGAFIFSVTDNRENTVTQTVNVPLIEYVSLSCNLNANAPDAEGDMVFSVSGNCFSGSFGAADNALKVYYRYKANNDEYGEEWFEAENVVLNDDNTYVAEVSLSGLDYTKKYTFQAKSIDKLMEIESVERVVKTIPVFDWGENDFNFNVPVNINGDLIVKGRLNAPYGYITGLVANITIVEAYGIIPFTERDKSGDYFTLADGVVTVGKNVSCVKVTATGGGAGENGRVWMQLMHNGTWITDAIQYGNYVSPCVIDIFSVNEGDTISISVTEKFSAVNGGVDCRILVERLM